MASDNCVAATDARVAEPLKDGQTSRQRTASIDIIRSIEYGRDLVILHCDETVNLPAPLHPGWTFEESTGALQMNIEAFVASEEMLQKLLIHGGVFISCPPFMSSQELAVAAAHVAINWDMVAIFHNRDPLSDLLDLFPGVKEILLPHNLNLLSREKTSSTLRLSRLRKLCGSCIGKSGCMVFSRKTSLELVLRCPQMQAAACDLRGLQIRSDKPSATTSVVLGTHGSHPVTGDLLVYSAASPAYVAATAFLSPRVTSIRLTTGRMAAISNLDLFSSLTTLDITYSGKERCPFAPTASAILQRHPLSSISLRRFDAVQVSSMITNCGTLTELLLKDCTIIDEDIQSHSLDMLQTCYLSAPITPKMMTSILAACSSNLIELGLGGDHLCSVFLQRTFGKVNCCALEMLTLKASSEMKGAEEDLKDLLSCCTHLKIVKTDCSGVRQFLEANAPHVCLVRFSCATCQAKLFKVNDPKAELGQKRGSL